MMNDINEKDQEIILYQCEGVISNGLDSISRIARALEIIKNMKLYENEYTCFENYCEDKFKLEKQDVNNLVKLVHLS